MRYRDNFYNDSVIGDLKFAKTDSNITTAIHEFHLDANIIPIDNASSYIHAYIPHISARATASDVMTPTSRTLQESRCFRTRYSNDTLVEYSCVKFSRWCTPLFLSLVVRISQHIRTLWDYI